MRTAYIQNTFYPDDRGGAEAVVLWRAKEAKKRGEESIIITLLPWSFGERFAVKQREHEGFRVYAIPAVNVGSYFSLSRHGFFWRLVWHVIDLLNIWTAKIIKDILVIEKITQVETHNCMGFGSGVFSLPSRLGVLHTHVFHDVQAVNPSGIISATRTRDTFFERIYFGFMRRHMGSPKIVQTGSQFLANFYRTRGFFPGAEWRLSRPEIPKVLHVEQVTTHDRAQTVPCRVTYLGSMSEHKGVRILMSAWEEFVHMNPSSRAELTLAGSGALSTTVEAWAKNIPRVTWLGQVQGEEKHSLLRQTDVLVVPSICIENTPTVILEGLAAGVRIIASRSGGIPELFSAAEGVLVTPGNSKELTTALSVEDTRKSRLHLREQ